MSLGRRVTVALAITLSILVVTALPASAAGLAVASIHTQPADFNAAAVAENVTVAGLGTAANVGLLADKTVTDPDDGSASETAWTGVVFDPSTNLSGVIITISGNTAGVTEARLVDHATDTVLVSTSFAAASGGDNITLTHDINATDEYYVQVRDGGNSYTAGNDSSPSFNYAGRLLDITSGIRGNLDIAGTRFTVENVTGLPTDRGVYISQNHSVDNASNGFTNLSAVTNATVTVTWEYVSGGSWTQAAQNKYTTTGNKSVDISAGSASSTWRVNVTIVNGTANGTPDVKLRDEGIEFWAHDPTIDDATADPDNEEFSSSPAPGSLSIDINDSDFPTAQGDTVTGEFKVKEPGATTFTAVGTDSRSSNGTISTSYSGTDGGEYEWRVNVTDDYGFSDQSAVFTFSIPENVTFRNESNASQIITGASITATFFAADGTTVIRRTDSNGDGNISLSGLPTTQEFVIVVEADQFYTRRVYIASIFEQQTIFLLNETAYPQAKRTTFTYEDRTGDFPRESTKLRIQRAVDIDNDDNFEWMTVAGDFWGAAGEFPFTGQTNERYRLIIENDAGEQRVLGTHIPVENGTKSIVVGEIEWPIINATGRTIDAELQIAQTRIATTYVDPTDNTTEVRIAVWELGNRSNEIYNQSFTSGPYGTLRVNVSLTANQSEMSWVVNYTAQTSVDGEVTGQTTVGSSPFALPLDPWLLGTFVWIGVTFVAFLYGPRTSHLGAWVLVIFVGGVMVLQLIEIPTASLVAAAVIATGGTIYREATT